MDIKNLSIEQKKELALELVQDLKTDIPTRQSLLDELQSIDNSSADADIAHWADPSKK